MRMQSLSAAETALLDPALASYIKRLMLDRADMGPDERVHATEQLDLAVALKKRLDDPAMDAVLVFGSNLKSTSAVGLSQVRGAAEELFGIGAIPDTLNQAIKQHEAAIASAMVGAAWVGLYLKPMIDAARKLLEAFGGDTPHFIRPEAMALEEAVQQFLDLKDRGNAGVDDELAQAIAKLEEMMPAWVSILRRIPGFQGPAVDDVETTRNQVENPQFVDGPEGWASEEQSDAFQAGEEAAQFDKGN